MTVERGLRGIAGFFIPVSVLPAHYHSPYGLFLAGFVAAVGFYQLASDDVHSQKDGR
ncbi:MAG: hypothetical protein ACYS4W_00405 [Planctomycetota bacterium]